MKRILMLTVGIGLSAGLWYWSDRSGEGGAAREPQGVAPEESRADGSGTPLVDSGGSSEPGTGPGEALELPAEVTAATEQAQADKPDLRGVTVMPPAIGTGMQAVGRPIEMEDPADVAAAFQERVRGWVDYLGGEADLGEEQQEALIGLLAQWSHDRAIAAQAGAEQLELERKARMDFERTVVEQLGSDAWERIEEAIEDEAPWDVE